MPVNFQYTLDDILQMGGPFQKGVHVPIGRIDHNMEKTLEMQCFQKGIPHVVQRWQGQRGWAPDVFTVDNLAQQLDGQPVSCVNQSSGKTLSMPVPEYGSYLDRCRSKKPPKPRIYAKDISCPPAWSAVVDKILPEYLRPLGPNDLL
ncbi:hypothetical protein DFQ27_002140, partial [Actinomortierella ambigua]